MIVASRWDWSGGPTAEQRGFSAAFFSGLGDRESLQGAEPLMFVDHPVNILTWFIKFFCSALFTRLFVMHLRKRENVTRLDFHVFLDVRTTPPRCHENSNELIEQTNLV